MLSASAAINRPDAQHFALQAPVTGRARFHSDFDALFIDFAGVFRV